METTQELHSIFTDEQKEAISNAFHKVVEALKEAWERVKEAIALTIKAFADFINSLSKGANKKVYNLACHSKRPRTRKKNMARLCKYINKLFGR